VKKFLFLALISTSVISTADSGNCVIISGQTGTGIIRDHNFYIGIKVDESKILLGVRKFEDLKVLRAALIPMQQNNICGPAFVERYSFGNADIKIGSMFTLKTRDGKEISFETVTFDQ
jgi:hypothetical protein